MKLRKERRSIFGTVFLALLLILFAVFMALPVVYMLSSSLKPPEEFFLFPPPIFPKSPTFDNFKDLGYSLSNAWIPFERYLFNSILLSVSSTLLYVAIASMAAYPLAKHQFPGKAAMNSVITLALMFTAAVLALPQYMILSLLGWIDTYLAILAPTLAGTMGVFLCVQFLETIPNSVLESGRMDGASEFRVWWSIVLPNIKPALFTMIIFQFQGAWNATGGGLIYTEALKTLPAAMTQIASAGIARAGVGSASAFILMIPPVLVLILSQSNVFETMAHSGIKD
ncbi:MAG: carbohydrate ABC transporter permease [Clostridiales bacterium]|nr:carbohydrate ABC transporter permease [Clostridiales bacterium]